MRASTSLVLLALGTVLGACSSGTVPSTADTDRAEADVGKADDPNGSPPDAVSPVDTTPLDDATSSDTANVSGCPVAPHAPIEAVMVGTGRFRTLTGIPNGGLSAREITVFLPAGYDADTERSYPVIYMHDGQNLFDDGTSFAGEWGVDETTDALVEDGAMEPVIMVGVWSTADPIGDYTPTADPDHGGGDGDAYVAWLADTLKPAVDALLRTECGRDETGIMGSGLGGLISLYAALTRPEVFGRVGVLSPALWWDDRVMLDLLAAYDGALPARLWLDMGTDEEDAHGDLPDGVALARAVRDRVMARGMTLGEDLDYFEAVGAAHNEAAWGQRLPAIFRYLYGTLPLESPSSLTLAFVNPLLSVADRPHTSAIVSTRNGTYGRITVPNPEVSFNVDGDAVEVAPDGGMTAVRGGRVTVTASYAGLDASQSVTVAGQE